jgi:uncharacterized protein YjeT (DUF2065 family)
VELEKLTDYGIVTVAVGLVLGWLGYPADILVTLGLVVVFIGLIFRFGIPRW